MNGRKTILGMQTTGVASVVFATPVIPADSVSIKQNASHLATVLSAVGQRWRSRSES